MLETNRQSDVEELRRFGFDEEGVEQVLLICAQVGISVANAVTLFGRSIRQTEQALDEVAAHIGLPEYEQRPSCNEHRLRSMRQPTGMPWDGRQR